MGWSCDRDVLEVAVDGATFSFPVRRIGGVGRRLEGENRDVLVVGVE